MTKQEIRLKCLELCYRKDQTPEASLATAKVLAEFIIGADEMKAQEKAPGKPGRPKSGNITN
jgi:hypothetical protein